MKHKSLITTLAAIMLIGSVGTVTTATSQPVLAISKHSWHWHRPLLSEF